MSSIITGVVDLGEIPAGLFDPALALRMAVAYGVTVIGSVVLKPGGARELRFAVPFEPHFLPGARLACPVRLVIGPNIPDLELLSIGGVTVGVDLARRQPNAAGQENGTERASGGIEAAVGTLRIPVEIYRCWLPRRPYAVHGRAACVN